MQVFSFMSHLTCKFGGAFNYKYMSSGIYIRSEETKKKMSKSHKGKKCHWWMNDPYPIDWTENLRQSIRKRDYYTCQICAKDFSLHIHHIDYNKQNCKRNNLITLCINCHMKTNYNREYWTSFFYYYKKLIEEEKNFKYKNF